MDILEVPLSVPVGVPTSGLRAAAPDIGFDARWAAWVERGRAHEARSRRRLAVGGTILMIAAAGLYGFLR